MITKKVVDSELFEQCCFCGEYAFTTTGGTYFCVNCLKIGTLYPIEEYNMSRSDSGNNERTLDGS
jgi:hypothetical protein